MNDYVTLGGAVLGLGFIVYQVIVWWPGVRGFRSDPVRSVLEILPFIYAWMYGVLLILCAGGLFGWVADMALWGSNWAGDGALVWGVGGQAGDNVTRGGAQALTNGGHAMVLLLTVVVLAMMKRARRGKSHIDTKMLGQGALSGICLGLTQGVAGAAAVPLASAVNVAGAWISTDVLA